MKLATLFIIAGALLFAVSQTAVGKPEVFSQTNPVDGTTSVAVRNNFIPHNGPFFAEIQLDPMKLPLRGSAPQYVISVVYGSNKWLFIEGPLVANIDGKVVSLKAAPIPGNRNVESSAVVSEMVPYFVNRSDLEKIARASKVIVQVAGRNGVFFLTLKPENIAAFRDFLSKTK